MKDIFLVVISVVLGVIGQILMKKGMNQIGEFNLTQISGFFHVFSNLLVLSGFLSYAISSVVWLAAISKMELSKAYPLLSLGYIIVVIASYFIFNEPLTSLKIIGVVLVAIGVLIIGIS